MTSYCIFINEKKNTIAPISSRLTLRRKYSNSLKMNEALLHFKIHLDMIPCITPLIFLNLLKRYVIVLMKQRSSVALVLIISLMCIDSESTSSLCGFPAPPARSPSLRPYDTERDAPLRKVTGCPTVSLLIFSIPFILSIIFEPLP